MASLPETYITYTPGETPEEERTFRLNAPFQWTVEDLQHRGAMVVNAASRLPEDYYAGRVPVYEQEFRAHAEPYGMSKSHTTLAWRTGARMSYPNVFSPLDVGSVTVIDLLAVFRRIRSIEAGEISHPSGLGQKSWNAYASLIHKYFGRGNDAAPEVLPWDPSLHPRLTYSSEPNRLLAANDLRRWYALPPMNHS